MVEDGETIEPTGFGNNEDNQFSHSQLVMVTMRKCIDNASIELIEGWWEDKVDKQGNVMRTYHSDTRKAFIESVKSLIMITDCDLIEEAKKGKRDVDDLLKKLGERKKHWLEQEYLWWRSLKPVEQMQMRAQGKGVVRGMFNKKLDFDNYYKDEETDIYRAIFEAINNALKLVSFYKVDTRGS